MAEAVQLVRSGIDWVGDEFSGMSSRAGRRTNHWLLCKGTHKCLTEIWMIKSTKTHRESRGPAGGPIRNDCGCVGSGFQPRNRLPALPVSGVKNPSPVIVGTGLGWGSSGGVRLMGEGRGGKSSSISGIEPGVRVINRGTIRA